MSNNKYARGATFERKIIKDGIEAGALMGMRGAGSKCYGKIKVDVVLLYEDRVTLIQCKKSKQKFAKEKIAFHVFKLPKQVNVQRLFIEG